VGGRQIDGNPKDNGQQGRVQPVAINPEDVILITPACVGDRMGK
jgi:hypothetical protein